MMTYLPYEKIVEIYISFDQNKEILKYKIDFKNFNMITFVMEPLVLWQSLEDKGFWIVIKHLDENEKQPLLKLWNNFLKYIDNYKSPKKFYKILFMIFI